MSFPGRRIPLLLSVTLLALCCCTRLALAADAEPAPLADRALLLDGQAVGNHLIAVGERGHILISTDAGRSWKQSPVPTRVTLTSVFFIDDRNGWAAGHDATILRTLDGGKTWHIVYSAPDLDAPILDLWFHDADNGLAVGAYGLLLETADGGASWEQRPLAVNTQSDATDFPGSDLHLNSLRATSNGQLFLAGERGTLLRSSDGLRWLTVVFPYEGSLFGTLPLDGDRLLAYGLRGHLFTSTDGGKRWQAIETGTESTLNDAIQLHDGRLVVVGLAGTILLGSADGSQFELLSQADRAGFACVLQAADGALVLLGNHGARRLELPAAGGPR